MREGLPMRNPQRNISVYEKNRKERQNHESGAGVNRLPFSCITGKCVPHYAQRKMAAVAAALRCESPARRTFY